MESSPDKQVDPAILVVDDAPFFRRMLRDLLEQRGYSVIEAASGTEVADLIARHNIGAVLTDIKMPLVTGPEVLRRVKRLRPEVPVIMISGHQDFAAAREVLRDGALDYLVKPIEPEELFAAVERALALLRQSQATALSIREAQKSLADLVLLKEVGETASTEENLQQLLDKILDSVRISLQVEVLSVMLPGEDGRLRIRSAVGLSPEIMASTRVAAGQGVAGYVLASGQPVLLEDIANDGRFVPHEGGLRYSTNSLLSVPIRLRDQVVGVLNVNNKLSGEAFSAADLNLLATIAHQTALAIENFKLVSSLREQARDLEQANRNLHRLNQARSRLVCNLSHELRTPLTAMLEFVDLAVNFSGQLSPEESQGYLYHALGEGQHLERLISGMLCLFSIDSGGGEWSLNAFPLRELVEEVLANRQEDLARLELHLELSLPKGLSPLYGDREKAGILLDALIDNAVKFNRLGGAIRLRAENCVTDGFSHVYLQIGNDGQAIPDHAFQDVFEQYNQMGELHSGKPQGIGIGLAISRAIVERMKGKIFLEPTSGEGTTFGVLLPTRESYGVQQS